jgi:hypothetical protein
METRSAILAYSLSEKIKTGLLWATQLVEMQTGLGETERSGARPMLRAIVAMLANEIRLAEKLLAADQWQNADKHVNLALVMIDSGVAREATFHLAKALSHVTSIGQRSMTALIDQGLL